MHQSIIRNMKIQFLFLNLGFFLVDCQKHFLKFGMLERPPHFMSKNSTAVKDQPFYGSWVGAIEWLSRRQHFEYTIIPINNNIVGNLQTVNGSATWSGASGRLLRGDFDVLGPQIFVSFGRSQFFDFAGVTDEENSAMLTPALTEENPITSTIKPFQPIVWLMVLISLVLVSVYFSTSSTLTLNPGNNKRPINMGDYVLYTISILTNQGPIFLRPFYQSKLSFRFTAGAWCLFAFIMVNVYCSTLTAHITSRKMSTPPGNSFQVMEEGVLRYLVVDDGFGRELILSATSGPLKKMGDMFRRHPEYFVPDQETGFLQVTSGCCAYSDVVNYLKFRTSKDFRETGKCRVHIGQTLKGYGSCGVILKKGNIHTIAINKGILEMYQTGLIEHWRKKYEFGSTSPCESQKKKKSKVLRRLNLKDLASAFFILALGISISLLVFLLEQCRRCKIFKIVGSHSLDQI